MAVFQVILGVCFLIVVAAYLIRGGPSGGRYTRPRRPGTRVIGHSTNGLGATGPADTGSSDCGAGGGSSDGGSCT